MLLTCCGSAEGDWTEIVHGMEQGVEDGEAITAPLGRDLPLNEDTSLDGPGMAYLGGQHKWRQSCSFRHKL